MDLIFYEFKINDLIQILYIFLGNYGLILIFKILHNIMVNIVINFKKKIISHLF